MKMESGVTKSLRYIIERNKDIINNTNNKTKEYFNLIETEEFKFFKSRRYCYLIYLFGKFYNIDTFIRLDDAKLILNNIDKIEYAYNIDKMCDTIFGDLSDSFQQYHSSGSKYMKYIISCVELPTRDDIVKFLENGGDYR